MYYKDKYGVVQDSRELYTTVVHELAHASHWEYSGTLDIQWLTDAGKKYTEIWAQCVGWYISKARYGDNYGDVNLQTLTFLK